MNSFHFESSDIPLNLSLLSFFHCPPVSFLNNTCQVQSPLPRYIRVPGKVAIVRHSYYPFVNFVHHLILKQPGDNYMKSGLMCQTLPYKYSEISDGTCRTLLDQQIISRSWNVSVPDIELHMSYYHCFAIVFSQKVNV